MLGTVIFSFPRGLKIKSFVLDSFNESFLALSQSVSNFSLLFMTQDISEGNNNNNQTWHKYNLST